jgi:hypothetical protein
LDLRDWRQDPGRFDRHIGKSGTPVPADTVAGKKVHLKIEKLGEDGQDGAQTSPATENIVVREIRTAAEQAADAIGFEMPLARIGRNFGHEIRPNIG